MNQSELSTLERLESLRDRTESIVASPQLRSRVFAAIAESGPPRWWFGVLGQARFGISVAVLAAVASVALALGAPWFEEDEQILAYGAVELWEQ